MSRILLIGGQARGLALFDLLVERGRPPLLVHALAEDPHEPPGPGAALLTRCRERDIACVSGRRIDDDGAEAIAAIAPDLVCVCGWRTMIPMRAFASAGAAVGAHDSLLPRYRGFAPSAWALINGETQSGVTLFHLSTGMDEGDIVGQRQIPIAPRTNAAELADAVATATVSLFDEYLDGLLDGTAPRRSQDHAAATYGCARTPDDGAIDWSRPTVEIDRLVRALSEPLPGAFTSHDGERLVVWEAEPVVPAPVYAGRVDGRVVAVRPDGAVDVLTGDGVLRLLRVGAPSGRAAERIRSVRTRLGDG